VYTIKFDFPNLPKGGEIDITGLYVENENKSPSHFENGKSYVIDDAMAENFRVSSPVVSTDKEGRATSEPGPTLLEAFKDNKFVVVSTVKAQKEGDK
jgi:hypothetical protein